MREMFSVVAPRYDFITRAFSYGMDRGWKRSAVRMAELPERARVLDLACGTGDFSLLVRESRPEALTVAADITHCMLTLARDHGIATPVCTDAMRLPFPDGTFDCVFIGYGLRNFPKLGEAVGEIGRVTRPGGALVSLDFFLPRNAVLRKFYLAYLFLQGGFWGLVLHGRPRIYTYIPDSLRSFVSVDEFTSLLRKSGYGRVNSHPYLFGGIGLHHAAKG